MINKIIWPWLACFLSLSCMEVLHTIQIVHKCISIIRLCWISFAADINDSQSHRFPISTFYLEDGGGGMWGEGAFPLTLLAMHSNYLIPCSHHSLEALHYKGYLMWSVCVCKANWSEPECWWECWKGREPSREMGVITQFSGKGAVERWLFGLVRPPISIHACWNVCNLAPV